MAATAIGNPAGAQWAEDFGTPRVITARAWQNISGGVFVYFSGATAAVGSVMTSFGNNDFGAVIDASGGLFNGIALQSTASGGLVPVATEGVFLLATNGTITAGAKVQCDGNNAVANAGSVAGNVAALRTIGRAITEAGSNTFALISIQA